MLVRANIFSANSSNYVGPKICWSPKFVSDPRSPCKQCWRQHIHQKSRKHVGPKEIFLGVTPMLAHVGPGQLFLDFPLSKLAVEKVGSSPRTYPFSGRFVVPSVEKIHTSRQQLLLVTVCRFTWWNFSIGNYPIKNLMQKIKREKS